MIAVAAAAALSACTPAAQDSDLPPGVDVTPSQAAAPSTEAPADGHGEATGDAHAEECTAKDFKVEGGSGEKPRITVPKDCSAPSELLTLDLEEGSGRAVKAGDDVEVNYHLVGFSDGEQKDSSWDRGQTFTVENVGQAQVIEGWNEGLIGLKEGGRRLLVVPPDKAYGEQGTQGIKPNETLVFVIGAVKVGGSAQ